MIDVNKSYKDIDTGRIYKGSLLIGATKDFFMLNRNKYPNDYAKRNDFEFVSNFIEATYHVVDI